MLLHGSLLLQDIVCYNRYARAMHRVLHTDYHGILFIIPYQDQDGIANTAWYRHPLCAAALSTPVDPTSLALSSKRRSKARAAARPRSPCYCSQVCSNEIPVYTADRAALVCVESEGVGGGGYCAVLCSAAALRCACVRACACSSAKRGGVFVRGRKRGTSKPEQTRQKA